MVFRGDITRIGGTYWNLSGYWRGRLTKESAASQQTLQNLINRTYHLNMTYDNPNSTLVAGFGRLYLPWAPSLDTIDGGYFGKRLSKGAMLGVFGGSTPDPSSWDYSPNRVIGGAFINFEGGEYDGFHYSSTSGAGVSMVNWAIDRPFVFFEDSVSYKRNIAVYESAQLDSPKGNSSTPSPGPGLGRNFFTLRVNPTRGSSWISTTTIFAMSRRSIRLWSAPDCSTSISSRDSAPAAASRSIESGLAFHQSGPEQRHRRREDFSESNVRHSPSGACRGSSCAPMPTTPSSIVRSALGRMSPSRSLGK